MYRYLKGSENEKYVRVCLSPEGEIITIQTGNPNSGVCSEDYLWRFDPDNYNFNGIKIDESLFAEFGINEIPKPLPLPKELKSLLKRKTENEFFCDEDFENEWVHTHFSELYEAKKRGYFPLLGGDENGAIYIEPSKRKGVILFCGRGDMACYYELDLNAL
jgi:hypothetical protein